MVFGNPEVRDMTTYTETPANSRKESLLPLGKNLDHHVGFLVRDHDEGLQDR